AMKQTTKSLVTTLGVLAAAAAIGGAALWVTRDTEKKAEQKEKSAKLFDGLDKAKVRQVKLVRDGKLVALVTRADAGAPWRIAEEGTKAPFEKQLLDLRDKRVLHLDDTAEVRRVQVAGTAPAYTLEKDGTAWKMAAPQKDTADTATADRVATALKSLRATGI